MARSGTRRWWIPWSARARDTRLQKGVKSPATIRGDVIVGVERVSSTPSHDSKTGVSFAITDVVAVTWTIPSRQSRPYTTSASICGTSLSDQRDGRSMATDLPSGSSALQVTGASGFALGAMQAAIEV